MYRAKTEVEKKVSRLVKFIQNKNKIPKDSKRELLAIINDLQEQCRSLYSSIDDFQQDSDPKNDGGGRRKAKSRIVSSSSDVEYYSSDEIENVDIFEEGNEIAELESKLEALRKEAEEKERELNSRVKELERELGDVKAECGRKGELEEEIAMKASESKQLGEKNKGLRSQISGLELVLKEKGDEISTLVNKFGNSELGLTSRIEDLKCQLRNLEQEIGFLRARNSEEKERAEGMKLEIESLRKHRDEVESKLETQGKEVTQLKRVKQETEEQVNRLNQEIDSLRGENEKLETQVKEATQLKSVKQETEEQVNRLNQEIDSLRGENEKLETQVKEVTQLKSVKQETEEQVNKLNQEIDSLRGENEKLHSKIAEQKESIEKFSEDLKQSKRLSLGSSRDSKTIERKMEELAEDFRMKIEDHIRILYRRIHVAEQIHIESKNEFIKARDMAQKNKENRESLVLFETHFKKIKDVLEEGYERSMRKLGEAEEFKNRVAKLAKEMDSARVWVSEKNNEVETLAAKLECKEAQECLLKEKLSKLEKKLGEEGTEKMNLGKVLSKLEGRIKVLEASVKGREVALLSLGEEKREAIRQLCILVDYQRDRFDELKKSISSSTRASLKT